jgi:hypothetical protein
MQEAIIYYPKHRKYGVFVNDGGTSIVTIDFCPWCGIKLPCRLSEMWVDILDEIGVDPSEKDQIPDDMKTDEWWKKRGL